MPDRQKDEIHHRSDRPTIKRWPTGASRFAPIARGVLHSGLLGRIGRGIGGRVTRMRRARGGFPSPTEFACAAMISPRGPREEPLLLGDRRRKLFSGPMRGPPPDSSSNSGQCAACHSKKKVLSAQSPLLSHREGHGLQTKVVFPRNLASPRPRASRSTRSSPRPTRYRVR